jgi:limonene-1,2-epoxide hydrolase
LLVREFLAAWERRDIEYILDLFADDAVYHAMPLRPIVGEEAIRSFCESRAHQPPPRIEIHHQVATERVVMNERTDDLVLNGREVTLRICAIFEIDNGRIKAWREYFDLAPAAAAYEAD